MRKFYLSFVIFLFVTTSSASSQPNIESTRGTTILMFKVYDTVWLASDSKQTTTDSNKQHSNSLIKLTAPAISF